MHLLAHSRKQTHQRVSAHLKGIDPTNTLWWIHRCWKWSPCRVFIACCRDPSRRVKYHVYVSMFASVQPYTRQVTSSSLACPHQWCICTVRKQIRIAKWGIGVSHLALKNVSGSVISRLRNPPYLAFLSESLFLVSANWLTSLVFPLTSSSPDNCLWTERLLLWTCLRQKLNPKDANMVN